MSERITLMGCAIDNLSMEETLQTVEGFIRTGEPHQHVVVNVDKLVKASRDADLRRIINAMSAIFMGLIAYIMFPEFLKMWGTQDFFGIPGVFTVPWWPIKLVIASGSALACLIFVLKVISAQDRPQLIRVPEHDDANSNGTPS